MPRCLWNSMTATLGRVAEGASWVADRKVKLGKAELDVNDGVAARADT